MAYALMGLGAFLTWLSFRRRNILLSLATGLTWFGLLVWFFLAEVPLIGISLNWQVYFCFVFLILTFVPFLALMDYEVKKTSKKTGSTWTEWGARPEEEKESGYDKYRRELEARTGRRVR